MRLGEEAMLDLRFEFRHVVLSLDEGGFLLLAHVSFHARRPAGTIQRRAASAASGNYPGGAQQI